MGDKGNNLLAVSDGEYVLTETEDDHQLYFYRNDGEEIGDVGRRLPMHMYRKYMFMKRQDGDDTDMVMNNISFGRSADGKSIILTIYEIGATIKVNQEPIVSTSESSFGQRIKSLLHMRKR